MPLQSLLAVIGCALVLLWLALRYFKIDTKPIQYLAIMGLLVLCLSLFVG